MIRMEMTRKEKETAEKRLAKYQQVITRREEKKNDRSKNVCGGCDTAD